MDVNFWNQCIKFNFNWEVEMGEKGVAVAEICDNDLLRQLDYWDWEVLIQVLGGGFERDSTFQRLSMGFSPDAHMK